MAACQRLAQFKAYFSPALTVETRLAADAPEAEPAPLRGHQDAPVLQLSVSSSTLQEQKAVDGGRRSGRAGRKSRAGNKAEVKVKQL